MNFRSWKQIQISFGNEKGIYIRNRVVGRNLARDPDRWTKLPVGAQSKTASQPDTTVPGDLAWRGPCAAGRPTGRGTAWPERALARLGAVSADARTPLGVAGGDSTTSKWRAQSQREDHRPTAHSLGKVAWVAVHRIKVAASRRGSRSLRRDPAQSEGG
jgi:hypothetical protein